MKSLLLIFILCLSLPAQSRVRPGGGDSVGVGNPLTRFCNHTLKGQFESKSGFCLSSALKLHLFLTDEGFDFSQGSPLPTPNPEARTCRSQAIGGEFLEESQNCRFSTVRAFQFVYKASHIRGTEAKDLYEALPQKAYRIESSQEKPKTYEKSLRGLQCQKTESLYRCQFRKNRLNSEELYKTLLTDVIEIQQGQKTIKSVHNLLCINYEVRDRHFIHNKYDCSLLE